MFFALGARKPSMDVTTILKEIQMPPLSFSSIMNRALCPALRAGVSASSFEVDVNVHFLLLWIFLTGEHLYIAYNPRIIQAKGSSKYIGGGKAVHRGAPLWSLRYQNSTTLN
jgi:hypothetical protein